ncbi:MAG: hypothetical protein HGB12_08430 [Bacteroidetes bacterium]|nr:hypothetical protein [Bacteroidota bacterium]
MKQTSFLRNIILLLLIALLFGNCNPLTNQRGTSTLIITVDTNCILSVDDVSYGNLKNGDVRKVKVNKGEHLVIAKNLDSTEVLIRQHVEIKDSTSIVLDLYISRKKDIVVNKDTNFVAAKTETKVETKVNENIGSTIQKTVIEPYGPLTDSRDGNIYKTVKIGNKIWMAENLRYKAKKGCWAYDDEESNVIKYGYLYDWETAKKAAPAGWHLPTDAEWTKLTTYLGGESNAGGKLKSITGWKSPNTGATNSVGFAAIPAGYRYFNYTYYGKDYYGYWWSSTEYYTFGAWYRVLSYNNSKVTAGYSSKNNGFSVLCVKD